ncbi:unnamed protein product [Schistocephalus solidus]|uniref:Secreted protein n=1 Tax=Schistocephalus solidus TaxID=70667 RepID=A0A183SVD6_SCHSO|nr:unnamed protein product [Schistocephalus solidus]
MHRVCACCRLPVCCDDLGCGKYTRSAVWRRQVTLTFMRLGCEHKRLYRADMSLMACLHTACDLAPDALICRDRTRIWC